LRPVERSGCRTVGAIVLRIAYGYQVNQENDSLINLVGEAVRIFSKAAAPGAFLIDSIPIRTYIHGILCTEVIRLVVKHVPEWVPGAGFQRQAREWKAVMDKVTDVPYNFVKSQMVTHSELWILFSTYFILGSWYGAEVLHFSFTRRSHVEPE